MKHISILSLLLFVLLIPSAQAYIPDFKMIMSRTAENHGRGVYQIIQDVTLQEEPEALVVRETWYIKGENQMRLEVRGRKRLEGLVAMTFIYDGNRRFYVDPNGAKKVSRPSDEWFEPYFHFRFQKNIKPMMVAAKMAPTEILEDDKPKKKVKAFDPNEPRKPQPYVRLSRIGGSVAYAVGEPTPAGANEALPGMWIEQDHFLIRKVRFPSQATVTANSYSQYANSLSLANQSTVSWENRQVQIQVVSVKPLPSSGTINKLLTDASLDFGKDPSVAIKLPEIEAVTEFYKRFR
ncbi:MAG: hypothetical protein H6624_14475 [Bdellovibrionaceae bacterium]|nr:hypothetical protein [Bdellovibrionales bacterium]MCB9085549.1 hypothetical protein [Pseudobdellovibrionaceae bacterium]